MADDSLTTIAAGTGIATAVASFIASFFYVGKRVGEVEKTIKQQGKTIEQQTMDIAQIKELFTKDGEPRFLTYNAHEKLQDSCQGKMETRLTNIEKKMDKHDDKLDKILDAMAGLPRRSHDQ